MSKEWPLWEVFIRSQHGMAHKHVGSLHASDAESVNSAQSAQWRIKLFSNDELRQRMVDQTVPQIDYLGLTVPDPDLKFNADTGHYEFGAIDWSEFHNVLKGNGPCNRERLRTRVKAWEDGAWFREALVAHADKHAAVKEVA